MAILLKSKILNYRTSTLYWIDSSDKTIRSINMTSGQITNVTDLSEFVHGNAVFGLALSPDGGTLYVSVWGVCTILAVDLQTGAVQTVLTGLGQAVLFSIATLPPALQPSGK